MFKRSNKKSPRFIRPLNPNDIELNIIEGKYFYTRGGWLAKVIYVSNTLSQCYVIHHPGTEYEIGPIFHDITTGYAIPFFSLLEPPAYTGHPADLIKEVSSN